MAKEDAERSLLARIIDPHGIITECHETSAELAAAVAAEDADITSAPTDRSRQSLVATAVSIDIPVLELPPGQGETPAEKEGEANSVQTSPLAGKDLIRSGFEAIVGEQVCAWINAEYEPSGEHIFAHVRRRSFPSSALLSPFTSTAGHRRSKSAATVPRSPLV